MIIEKFNIRFDKCLYQNPLIFSKLFCSSLDLFPTFLNTHLLQESGIDEFTSEVSKQRLRRDTPHSAVL